MNVIHIIRLIGVWGFLIVAVALLIIERNSGNVLPFLAASIAFSLAPEA